MQRICDLEVKIGTEKISLANVVIADIDFNVLSCFSMQERGWKTVLGSRNACSEGQDAVSHRDVGTRLVDADEIYACN